MINIPREGDLIQLLGQREKEECWQQLVKEALPGLASKQKGEIAKGTDDGDDQSTRKTEDEKEHVG